MCGPCLGAWEPSLLCYSRHWKPYEETGARMLNNTAFCPWDLATSLALPGHGGTVFLTHRVHESTHRSLPCLWNAALVDAQILSPHRLSVSIGSSLPLHYPHLSPTPRLWSTSIEAVWKPFFYILAIHLNLLSTP